MTTPTPEAIESIATQVETMHGILAYNGSQVVCACDRTWKPAEDYAAHITRATAPFIAAQARAEALREAAEYIDAGDYADMNPDGTMRPRLTQVQISQRNRTVTANWLRNRAATIEGKSE